MTLNFTIDELKEKRKQVNDTLAGDWPKDTMSKVQVRQLINDALDLHTQVESLNDEIENAEIEDRAKFIYTGKFKKIRFAWDIPTGVDKDIIAQEIAKYIEAKRTELDIELKANVISLGEHIDWINAFSLWQKQLEQGSTVDLRIRVNEKDLPQDVPDQPISPPLADPIPTV